MKYALLYLLPFLYVTACAQPPSESETHTEAAKNPVTAVTSEADPGDEFVKACLEKMNWERPLCECVETKARERLSDDGYAFQIAVFREDEAETTRLRERMPFEEIAQAGMFMVHASRECAEEGG